MSNHTKQTTREILQGHIQEKSPEEQEKILEAFDNIGEKAQRAAVGIMHLMRTGTFLEADDDETN